MRPVAAIIYGDNGTGKSTIVDALEFALQARIQRNKNVTRRSTQSFSVNNSAKVTVHLHNNKYFTRSLLEKEEKLVINDQAPHPNFSVSPIALCRSDILRFWGTEHLQRMRVFFDFLRKVEYHDTAWEPLSEDKLRELEERRYGLKNQRRIMAASLADQLDIDVDDIPLDPQHFNEFVNFHVFGGRNSRERKQIIYNGGKPYVNRELQNLANTIKELSNQISALNKEIGLLKKPTFSSSGPSKFQLIEALLRIDHDLNEAFRSISPSREFIETITLAIADQTDVSLTIDVKLVNGLIISPEEIFSEANLDLLALLLYLALALESSRHGQAKVLILDDVFQSVDASIRLRAFEWIIVKFKEWQLIITAHDRLWCEQLRALFARVGQPVIQHNIIRWNFKDGPYIIQTNRTQLIKKLEDSLNSFDIPSICAIAGLALEEIAHQLSYSLPISVTRRVGDKYTLGDLWPGIVKKLKRTNIKEIAMEADRWIHLRNLVGAHYNEWALTLSLQEAHDFASSAKMLLEMVYCLQCEKWIEPFGLQANYSQWQCRCGQLAIISV